MSLDEGDERTDRAFEWLTGEAFPSMENSAEKVGNHYSITRYGMGCFSDAGVLCPRGLDLHLCLYHRAAVHPSVVHYIWTPNTHSAQQETKQG